MTHRMGRTCQSRGLVWQPHKYLIALLSQSTALPCGHFKQESGRSTCFITWAKALGPLPNETFQILDFPLTRHQVQNLSLPSFSRKALEDHQLLHVSEQQVYFRKQKSKNNYICSWKSHFPLCFSFMTEQEASSRYQIQQPFSLHNRQAKVSLVGLRWAREPVRIWSQVSPVQILFLHSSRCPIHTGTLDYSRFLQVPAKHPPTCPDRSPYAERQHKTWTRHDPWIWLWTTHWHNLSFVPVDQPQCSMGNFRLRSYPN